MVQLAARLFYQESSDSLMCTFDYFPILVNASTEVVSMFLAGIVIDRFGRTSSQCCLYILSGVTVALLGIPMSSVMVTVIAALSRMFIAAASSLTGIATQEVLHTKVRCTGHSIASSMAGIGAALSPFFVQNKIPVWVVGVTLGLINLLSGACAMALPETAGHGLDEVASSATKSKAAKNVSSLERVRDKKKPTGQELVGLLHSQLDDSVSSALTVDSTAKLPNNLNV